MNNETLLVISLTDTDSDGVQYLSFIVTCVLLLE